MLVVRPTRAVIASTECAVAEPPSEDESFVVASHERADASRRGGGCFLWLAIVSTAAFLWKWWDVGHALQTGREVRMHVLLVPFYEWLGRPGILLCGGAMTSLFAAFAIAGFAGRRRATTRR
ncbi:MAG: hypothetical protein H6721_19025 [Sandaracinus sp.]|nr:hypothetical protein [Sandaracinus sp.]MCB9634221.1 hypothetical protein [Sandaracinus sp.]